MPEENEGQVQNPTTPTQEPTQEPVLAPEILAGDALEPSITIAGEIAYRPTDNDGNEENYVDATAYDGYAKRISHDKDVISERIYDKYYAPEATSYAVVMKVTENGKEVEKEVESATMVVGEVRKFVVRSSNTALKNVNEKESAPASNEDPKPEEFDSTVWGEDLPGIAWESTDTEKAIIVEGNKVRAIGVGVVKMRIWSTLNDNLVREFTITISEPNINDEFTIVV
jgi:hypothetical protein